MLSTYDCVYTSSYPPTLFLSVLPLFVHIKTARSALSAERVYDIHCITFGSRPSALVTWWLGNTQLLDHSTSVRHHVTNILGLAVLFTELEDYLITVQLVFLVCLEFLELLRLDRLYTPTMVIMSAFLSLSLLRRYS